MSKTTSGDEPIDPPNWQPVDVGTIAKLTERIRQLEAENVALREQAQAGEDTVLRAERSRVAEHLHDGVAQMLALVMLKMEIIARLMDKNPTAAKEEMERASDLMESCVYELRRAVYSLRAPDVERLGFRHAMKRLKEGIRDQMNVDVALSVPDELPIPKTSQLVLFQVLQERLDHIAKAGSSTNLAIEITLEDNLLVARLREEGFQGIRRREDPNSGERLQRQQGQIDRLGGTMRIIEHPTETIVEITLPTG